MATPTTPEAVALAHRQMFAYMQMDRAEVKYHDWLRRVHDMPNSEYQRGCQWFKAMRDYTSKIAKEVK